MPKLLQELAAELHHNLGNSKYNIPLLTLFLHSISGFPVQRQNVYSEKVLLIQAKLLNAEVSIPEKWKFEFDLDLMMSRKQSDALFDAITAYTLQMAQAPNKPRLLFQLLSVVYSQRFTDAISDGIQKKVKSMVLQLCQRGSLKECIPHQQQILSLDELEDVLNVILNVDFNIPIPKMVLTSLRITLAQLRPTNKLNLEKQQYRHTLYQKLFQQLDSQTVKLIFAVNQNIEPMVGKDGYCYGYNRVWEEEYLLPHILFPEKKLQSHSSYQLSNNAFFDVAALGIPFSKHIIHSQKYQFFDGLEQSRRTLWQDFTQKAVKQIVAVMEKCPPHHLIRLRLGRAPTMFHSFFVSRKALSIITWHEMRLYIEPDFVHFFDANAGWFLCKRDEGYNALHRMLEILFNALGYDNKYNVLSMQSLDSFNHQVALGGSGLGTS